MRSAPGKPVFINLLYQFVSFMVYSQQFHIRTNTEKDDSMPTSSNPSNRSVVRANALVDMAAELGRGGVAGAMSRRRTTLIARCWR